MCRRIVAPSFSGSNSTSFSRFLNPKEKKSENLKRRQTTQHNIPEDSTTAVTTSNLAENKLLVLMTGNAGPNSEYEYQGGSRPNAKQ